MKIRAIHIPMISLATIIFLVLCGILFTHCKKYEVSSVIIVKTAGVSEVTLTSCRAAGMLVDIGSTGVSQHGFCWSYTSNIAEAIDCKSLGRKDERGGFNNIIEGFTPGTQYYVWAFAENEDGRKYGDPVAFSTISGSLPTVHTHSIEEITPTTALAAGSISDDGGAEILEKGICFDLNPDPTLESNVLRAEDNTDHFDLTLEGLLPNTRYFVRAFASNAGGTAYGENQEFRTLPEFSELVDERDGKHYQTVKIGEQWWMAQNLDHGDMISITNSSMENEIIEKYCWGDDPANCETFGALYHWEEMMMYRLDDSHGVCPDGWHIPTDDEWRIMEMTIGLTEEETLIMNNARGGIAGGWLKAIGEEFWDAPNAGATDELGFHALGSGFIDGSKNYSSLRVYAPIWTSSAIEDEPLIRGVAYDHSEIYRGPATANILGCAVRCVKD